LRVRPTVREVLVVEDRNALARPAEDLDDLGQELVARIEDLSLVVAAVVAVFADQQDALNGEPVAALRQSVGNRPRHLYLEVAADLARHVILGLLVPLETPDPTTPNPHHPPAP